jgi:hypothetical protein
MLIYNAGGDSIAGSDTMQRIKVLRALAADVPLVIFSERESREEIISALNVRHSTWCMEWSRRLLPVNTPLRVGRNPNQSIDSTPFVVEPHVSKRP